MELGEAEGVKTEMIELKKVGERNYDLMVDRGSVCLIEEVDERCKKVNLTFKGKTFGCNFFASNVSVNTAAGIVRVELVEKRILGR